MIYHGDEDPSIYLAEGEKRIDFFTKLFRDRRELIGNTNATEYLYTGTPVMAFLRGKGTGAVWCWSTCPISRRHSTCPPIRARRLW